MDVFGIRPRPMLLALCLALAAIPLHAAPKPTVFAQRIELVDLSESLTYPARIEPRVKASVLAENDGIVSKILKTLGTKVKAGEPLLTITNTDPIYNYSPLNIVSPVDGVVSRIDVTEGSRVSKGDKLLLVTDPNLLRVLTEITAQDLGSLRPRMLAELHLPGREKAISVRVRGVSPFVDPQTGTAPCELEALAEADRVALLQAAAGSIGRVIFRTNQRKGISILEGALTYRGKIPYVRVIEAGKAKLSPVTLGKKDGVTVEILKGLEPGQLIVERASGFLADGDEVDVQSGATPQRHGG